MPLIPIRITSISLKLVVYKNLLRAESFGFNYPHCNSTQPQLLRTLSLYYSP